MQTRNKAQANFTVGNGGGGVPVNGAGTSTIKGSKPSSNGGATGVGSSTLDDRYLNTRKRFLVLPCDHRQCNKGHNWDWYLDGR